MPPDEERSPAFHIRPAARDDVPAILSLIRGLAEYEKLSHRLEVTEDLLHHWLFLDAKVEVVLGVEDGEAVGMAMFFPTFSSFLGRPGLFLEDLFVRPEKRGRGYGKKLFCYVAAEVAKRGYGRMEWTCLDWNQPSIDFYLAMGAEAVSDWRVFRLVGDRLDALVDAMKE